MAGPVREPDIVEQPLDPALAGRLRRGTIEDQGQCDVLGHSEPGHQVEELEHKAELPPPYLGPRSRCQSGQVAPAEQDTAGVGCGQSSGQMQQGGLARSALADHGDELAGRDGEVDPAQRDDRFAAPAEGPAHSFQGQHRFRVGSGRAHFVCGRCRSSHASSPNRALSCSVL